MHNPVRRSADPTTVPNFSCARTSTRILSNVLLHLEDAAYHQGMTPELQRALKRHTQWFGSYKKSGELIKIKDTGVAGPESWPDRVPDAGEFI
jgi:hypothetical protein